MLRGYGGFDQLVGGADNDELDGGNDGIVDWLWGELGADVFRLYNQDRAWDFNAGQGDRSI